MKTTFFLIVGFLLFLVTESANSQDVTKPNSDLQQREVSVMCAPDLYDLTSKWGSEFYKSHPSIKINVISTNTSSSDYDTGEHLSFISAKSSTVLSSDENWKMVVGRNVIVPVVNVSNPFLKELLQRGVSREDFLQVFTNPDEQNWASVLGNSQNSSMNIYVLNETSVKDAVARFLQVAQIPAKGIVIQSKNKFIESLQNDPNAIGFCSVVDIPGMDNQGVAGNIRLLPIDKNGNGTIDSMEDIYGDVNELLRGVWIGKYPKTLYSNIYAVSKKQPAGDMEIAFLSWVLTDGQQFLNSNGYCDLVSSESQSLLEKFNTPLLNIQPENRTSNARLILVLIAAMVLVLGVIISSVVRKYRKQAPVIPDLNDPLLNFSECSVDLPNGLYYDKSHTWAFMEKDGSVSIGIDDFLQHITGPITRVDMKKAGEKFKKGDLLFSIIQIGKQLNLYAPVSGTIKNQNELLITDTSSLNSSPYNEGWIYKIEPANWIKEIQFLDMAPKYKRWIITEFSRVKDFLASMLKPESIQYTNVVLQDGGILKDGVLADFGPEVWEDFQAYFLDNYK